jgi:tetratricopeptide (TPR) repeat protein
MGGALVGGRYVVERRVRGGGMGDIHLARDNETNDTIALKTVDSSDALTRARLAQEGQILAELRHANIVRYLDHGVTTGGSPFLAMEWLEGETLAWRLSNAPLSIAETIALAGGVARALAEVHARGIVHRDIKPSNLFLPDGDVAQVKLLDFGIARWEDPASDLTRAGTIIGTPAYMAPEQARCERDVTPALDVFSLGAVLFECLAGRRAFDGGSEMAVLTKVLFYTPPEVTDHRVDAPAPLSRLIGRMLAKDPVERPAGGASVLRAIEQLADEPAIPPAADGAAAVTSTEQRFLSVVLCGPPPDRPGPAGGSDHVDTAVLPSQQGRHPAVEATLARFGGTMAVIADGSIAATISGAGNARDHAATAARCALSLRELLPTASLAIATGRGFHARSSTMGDVIDRAAALLKASASPSAPGRGHDPPPICACDLTVGLLDRRFRIAGADGVFILSGYQHSDEATGTLLGKRMPFVGRHQEIAALERMFDACVSERSARAVLVTGPAGVGKSRLRIELTRQIRERDARVLLWSSRSDPMSAGSGFALLAPALHAAIGVDGADPAGVQQNKLAARAALHFEGRELSRVTEFLCELTGIPNTGPASEQLRAARRDPRVMGDQVRRAWLDFVGAETEAQPLLLVLEDLHWGDWPSISFVASALRQHGNRALMVLAFARPEIDRAFPELWSGLPVARLDLAPLPPEAAEALIRMGLGDAFEPSLATRIAERAAGSAFYLEELIRAVASGRSGHLPETVLATAQERVERLDALARRALRGASVFGRVFHAGGVLALLGDSCPADDLDAAIDTLVDEELIHRRSGSRFAGQAELEFRHDLLREAVYAMLPDADRANAHRAAGDWLERAGEQRAAILAEHFERGGAPARAIGWSVRAAEQALEANDPSTAVAMAERGIRLGAVGEALGSLQLVHAEERKWHGAFAESEAFAREALDLLPAASDRWTWAAWIAANAIGALGRHDDLLELSRRLTDSSVAQADMTTIAMTLGFVAQILFVDGKSDDGDAVLAAAEARPQTLAEHPAAMARVLQARANQRMCRGDIAGYLLLIEHGTDGLAEAGDRRAQYSQRVNLGVAYLQVGACERAEQCLRESLSQAEEMELHSVAAAAKMNLGMAVAFQGRLDEALALEAGAVELFSSQGYARLEGASRIYLAQVLAMTGDLAGAEGEACRAIEVCSGSPPMRAQAMASLADVMLAGDRPDDALQVATDAAALLDELGGIEDGEALVRIVHVEALYRVGRTDDADRILARARDRLLECASKITDSDLREGFLGRIPENRRTLALASERL